MRITMGTGESHHDEFKMTENSAGGLGAKAQPDAVRDFTVTEVAHY